VEYKEFGIDFARRAGEIIKRNFGLGMQRQWKSDNTPVTETDLLVN
jgi:fructose-1,6-bisphosphatase/inositol monophosphatase family enzyme